MNPIFKKLSDRGFVRVNAVKKKGEPETCSMTSYSMGADTTVMRFERGDMFVAVGLMGQMFLEMTIGIIPLGMVYKKPLREFSDEELDDLLDRIKNGEVPTPKFFKKEMENDIVMWEINPEYI